MKNYLYRSTIQQYNSSVILLYIVLLVIDYICFINNPIFFHLINIILLLLLFFILKNSVNVFYFYDNKIIIFYFLRLKKRKKIYTYDEIKEIVYINRDSREDPVVIVFKGQNFTKKITPSNSFTHICFKKRQEILKFLNRKGIPIKINSLFERDKNILNEKKS